MGRIKIAIVGVGNCASSLVQGLSYYADKRAEDADRPDALGDRRLPAPGHRGGRAFDIDVRKVGKDVCRGDLREAQLHGASSAPSIPKTRRAGAHGPRARRRLPSTCRTTRTTGRFLVAGRSRSRRARTWSTRCAIRAPRCWSTTCRSAPSRPRASTPSARSRPASRWSTACRSSSPATRRWRGALRRARHPDRRRRHQGAARRHHHPPHAHRSLPQARRQARAHLPAQHRRQHRLPQHAEPQPARVEEGLEDRGGAVGGGRRASRTRTSTSGPATTWPGRTTTRSASCAWRGSSSATCRCTSSCASRSRTRRTRPASRSTRSAARSSRSTAASAARSTRAVRLLHEAPAAAGGPTTRPIARIEAFIAGELER